MSITAQTPSIYRPGQDVTGEVTGAAVTSRRLVKIAGNRTAGGNVAIATCGNGERCFGVAARDADVGQLVQVVRAGVVWVHTSATIAAGQEVQAGGNGTVIALAAGTAIGYALTGCASGSDAEISLYT